MTDDNSKFHRIGKVIYFRRSSQSDITLTSPNDISLPLVGQPAPTLILIFGWMGARLSHLYKYTEVYEELYPDATKILIRCEPSFFWSRERTRQTHLSPVVDALQASGYLPLPHIKHLTSRPQLLIHVFSNGGCSQLLCLGRLLASRFPDLPIAERNMTAIILDSSPGFGDLKYNKQAFTSLIRNALFRWAMIIFASSIYLYFAIVRRLFGTKDFGQALKDDLNRSRLLPWVDEHSPRLYIYSKADEIVPCKGVEEHIRAAKDVGLDVRSEKYEDSPHVSHARVDPVRYWGAVKNVWKDACNQ